MRNAWRSFEEKNGEIIVFEFKFANRATTPPPHHHTALNLAVLDVGGQRLLGLLQRERQGFDRLNVTRRHRLARS